MRTPLTGSAAKKGRRSGAPTVTPFSPSPTPFKNYHGHATCSLLLPAPFAPNPPRAVQLGERRGASFACEVTRARPLPENLAFFPTARTYSTSEPPPPPAPSRYT